MRRASPYGTKPTFSGYRGQVRLPAHCRRSGRNVRCAPIQSAPTPCPFCSLQFAARGVTRNSQPPPATRAAIRRLPASNHPSIAPSLPAAGCLDQRPAARSTSVAATGARAADQGRGAGPCSRRLGMPPRPRGLSQAFAHFAASFSGTGVASRRASRGGQAPHNSGLE